MESPFPLALCATVATPEVWGKLPYVRDNGVRDILKREIRYLIE